MNDRIDKKKSPVDLMEVIKVRRSYRKYADERLPAGKMDYLKKVVLEGASAFDFKSPFFIFVTEPDLKKRLRRAVFSGLMGKVNPWILTTKAFGFVVCCGYPNRLPTAPILPLS